MKPDAKVILKNGTILAFEARMTTVDLILDDLDIQRLDWTEGEEEVATPYTEPVNALGVIQ